MNSWWYCYQFYYRNYSCYDHHSIYCILQEFHNEFQKGLCRISFSSFWHMLGKTNQQHICWMSAINSILVHFLNIHIYIHQKILFYRQKCIHKSANSNETFIDYNLKIENWIVNAFHVLPINDLSIFSRVLSKTFDRGAINYKNNSQLFLQLVLRWL